MDNITLPKDFKEFLQLLNEKSVKYLLVGGFAVGLYGYVRATADIDIWISSAQENAEKVVEVFREFGFASSGVQAEWFTRPNDIFTLGVSPVKIELMTAISGVEFEECFAARRLVELDGIPVNLINLKHLRQNKAASGRLKDLADLKALPQDL